MKRPLLRTLPALIALALAMLACSLPTNRTALPTSTPTSIAVSTEQAGAFADRLATSVAELETNGSTTIRISEQEMTSYAALVLIRQTDVPVSDAQVQLQNGQITLSGKATLSVLTANVTIVFEPVLVEGRLRVNVVSADVGALPVPDTFLTRLTDAVNQNLNSFLTGDNNNLVIENVEISNGVMTLTARTN